jgi:hypothetical protein
MGEASGMKKPNFWHAGLLVALGGLATHLAHAQSTTDCSAVADDTARLKCYDGQAVRKKKAASPPASAAGAASSGSASASRAPATPATPALKPTSPASASTPPASSAATDFGLDPETVRKKNAAANPEAPKPPEQVVGRVKSVVTKPRGQYRITLEDGQVWEETQHTGGAAPEMGDTVTIKRGVLGSYFLSRSTGLALRVKRID